MDFDAITPELRRGVCADFGRIARRWVLAFCQAEAVAAWRDAYRESGLKYIRPVIWTKPNGQPQLNGCGPGMGYESIAVGHSTERVTKWNAGGKLGVYPFCTIAAGMEASVHMSQKPVELMLALIRDFTDPGDLVVDPFAGSGTTGVACIRLGRRFIGWERDPRFRAAALKRLEQTHEQPELVSNEAFAREAKKKRKQVALALPEVK